MISLLKKRLLAVLTITACLSGVKAQLSEGGTPASFNYPETLRSGSPESVQIFSSPFSIRQLREADIEEEEEGAPIRIATLLPADLSPDNSGEWLTLPGGEKIWRLRIKVPEATALTLYYRSFSIPPGGKLFIYNSAKTQILGAYTYQTNPSTAYFATEFVAGEETILEYEAPEKSGVPVTPDIQIEEIGYGYRDFLVPQLTSVQASGSCNVNVNCEEGNLWESEKKGICKLQMRIGTGTYLCSGSLINNTAGDLKPYILTAAHCLNNGKKTATDQELAQWIFIFNYEKSGCSNSSDAKEHFSVTGCKNIAAIPLNQGSDGLLLLLTQSFSSPEKIYYNGWDRRNTPASSGVGIHHPGGDVKKISTFTSPAVHFTWITSSESGAPNAHWDVLFSATPNGYGITEGGSSGSPLFNQQNLIVGTLTGGNSDCTYPGGHNVYGKLYSHWDQYAVASTRRMDIYLDPLQTGATTWPGCYFSEKILAPLHLIAVPSAEKADLQWEKPAYYETPVQYRIYRNDIKIGTTEECAYSDFPEKGQNTYYITAVYTGGRESVPSLPVSVSGIRTAAVAQKYQCYPNPVDAGKYVYIKAPGSLPEPVRISVTDPSGKLILQQQSKERLTPLLLTAAGTYIIRLENSAMKSQEFKIIVR